MTDLQDADKVIPVVKVKFEDGKEHQIKCSFGLLIRFKKMTGKDLGSVLKDLDPDTCVKIVAIGIYGNEAEAHLDEVADQMGYMHLVEVSEIIVKLFDTSAVEAKKKELEVIATDQEKKTKGKTESQNPSSPG